MVSEFECHRLINCKCRQLRQLLLCHQKNPYYPHRMYPEKFHREQHHWYLLIHYYLLGCAALISSLGVRFIFNPTFLYDLFISVLCIAVSGSHAQIHHIQYCRISANKQSLTYRVGSFPVIFKCVLTFLYIKYPKNILNKFHTVSNFEAYKYTHIHRLVLTRNIRREDTTIRFSSIPSSLRTLLLSRPLCALHLSRSKIQYTFPSLLMCLCHTIFLIHQTVTYVK